MEIDNNLINDNIFPLKVNSRCVIFGDNQCVPKCKFHIQNLLVCLFQLDTLLTLAHMLNEYEMCHNTTHYLIYSMSKTGILKDCIFKCVF